MFFLNIYISISSCSVWFMFLRKFMVAVIMFSCRFFISVAHIILNFVFIRGAVVVVVIAVTAPALIALIPLKW